MKLINKKTTKITNLIFCKNKKIYFNRNLMIWLKIIMLRMNKLKNRKNSKNKIKLKLKKKKKKKNLRILDSNF